MKKLIALIIVVCLVFAFAAGCGSVESTGDAASAETTETPVQETAAVETPALDYDALRAIHADDEIVATVNGREVTWGEYYGWLYMNARQIENYFAQMAMYYGMSAGWSDSMDDSGTTFAQYAVQSAENTIKQFAAIEAFTEKNGIKLDETALADRLAEQKKTDTASICGEGATEDDLVEKLGEMNLSMDAYELMTLSNIKYQENFNALYGEDSELVSDEDALSYFKENGYMSANHILIMTKDPSTGEELSDADKADKKAKADELLQQLRASDDPVALFDQLMNENSEDTGLAANPDGYTTSKGAMVPEFEQAALALKEGEISDVVESDYGYHIILRLPLDLDQFRSQLIGDKMEQQSNQWLEEYGVKTNEVYDQIDPQAFWEKAQSLTLGAKNEIQAVMDAKAAEDSSSSADGSASTGTAGSSSSGS